MRLFVFVTLKIPRLLLILSNHQTYTSLILFIFAMLFHPEAQKDAQAEIDRVVGPHRLPDFNDHTVLPYIEAVVREVLRLYPVAPLGNILMCCTVHALNKCYI